MSVIVCGMNDSKEAMVWGEPWEPDKSSALQRRRARMSRADKHALYELTSDYQIVPLIPPLPRAKRESRQLIPKVLFTANLLVGIVAGGETYMQYNQLVDNTDAFNLTPEGQEIGRLRSLAKDIQIASDYLAAKPYPNGSMFKKTIAQAEVQMNDSDASVKDEVDAIVQVIPDIPEVRTFRGKLVTRDTFFPEQSALTELATDYTHKADFYTLSPATKSLQDSEFDNINHMLVFSAIALVTLVTGGNLWNRLLGKRKQNR